MEASAPTFASLLQDFFCQRLVAERNASSRTIASYRDSFRLLLRFAATRLGKSPTSLSVSDLGASLVVDFLRHLETDRGNCARSRNARLAAIRSFMRYVSYRDPVSLQFGQHVLAIPMKRFDRPLLGYLSSEEVEAILAAPDRSTWSGRRDHAMFVTLYNTGARVSELAALTVGDLTLDRGRCARINGKGRKERVVPLWKTTVAALKKWLPEVSSGQDTAAFPNRRGLRLSRSGIEKRLQGAVQKACQQCPWLRNRTISPHTFRHTTAMHLLQSGVDITVIAMWLGHESPATTHMYVEADLAMKERALAMLQEVPSRPCRYKASDRLLAFLDGL
ncbi:MAG: tyrosine-type recombinase/integrase [Gemmatimonadota bacterium]|nr:MAG: tyrosine-type recombinase/integrase [Gemmatimonadota bacterium]